MPSNQLSRRSIIGGLLAAFASLFVKKAPAAPQVNLPAPMSKPSPGTAVCYSTTFGSPGLVTTLVYDANARLLCQMDPLFPTTTLTYDGGSR
jgi:YD repeat-containing protein